MQLLSQNNNVTQMPQIHIAVAVLDGVGFGWHQIAYFTGRRQSQNC
jgi:hypothetical protein